MKRKYKKTYLTKVLLRLDFNELVDFDKIIDNVVNEKIKTVFIEKCKDNIRFRDEIQFITNAKTKSVSGKSNRISFLERTYKNKDNTNILKITNDFIIFDYSLYDSFTVFAKEVNTVLKELYEKGKLIVKRIGLRYINQYNINDALTTVSKNMFSEKIKNVMVDSLLPKSKELKSLRNLLNSEYLYKDIRINYFAGLYNNRYPLQIENESFTIDIDCYKNGIIDNINEIKTFLNTAHEVENIMFEQSINDKMRKCMNK